MLKGIFRGVINSVGCIFLGIITGAVFIVGCMDNLGWIKYERIGDFYYRYSKK